MRHRAPAADQSGRAQRLDRVQGAGGPVGVEGVAVALDRQLRLRAQDLTTLVRESNASLADTAGNPFRNKGQCVKYVKHGGVLVARPFLSLVWSQPNADGKVWGTVTGAGLQPGANLYGHVDGGTDVDIYRVSGDGTLAFTWGFFTCGEWTGHTVYTLDRWGAPIQARAEPPC